MNHESPVTMNRAARRKLGFRGPVWFRDKQAPAFSIPRFVRRHSTQKKYRAKIARLMKGRMPS